MKVQLNDFNRMCLKQGHCTAINEAYLQKSSSPFALPARSRLLNIVQITPHRKCESTCFQITEKLTIRVHDENGKNVFIDRKNTSI